MRLALSDKSEITPRREVLTPWDEDLFPVLGPVVIAPLNNNACSGGLLE